jgi:TolB-like protein
MRKLRQFLVALAVCLLTPSVSRAADPPFATEKLETANRPKIAVADFRGSDVELSRFLAETVISNLSTSRTLKPLDRPTVRRALAAEVIEVDAEPTQDEILRAGKRLRSAYFLTGSYLLHGDKILLLAHLHTLKDMDEPSVAIRCTGDRADIMDVATHLSDQILERLTPAHEEARPIREEARPVEEEVRIPREEVRAAERPAPLVPHIVVDPMAALRASGLCPAGATSGTNLSEGDLARLLDRLAETAAVRTSFTLPRNATPAPRMLALAGLVKLMLTPEEIAEYRRNLPGTLPEDFARLPLWGQPFLAAAVDHGWWNSAKPFHSSGSANWAFVAFVTSKMGMTEPQPPPHRDLKPQRPVEVEVEDENYTGLVIDGRDLPVERSQSPSILDEEGNLLYPYEKHAPNEDYVNASGMVDYNVEVREQTRAGKHPLVVQAIRLSGNFHDDLVVSNEDAERIRRAQKRSRFLWQWKVVFLVPGNN